MKEGPGSEEGAHVKGLATVCCLALIPVSFRLTGFLSLLPSS